MQPVAKANRWQKLTVEQRLWLKVDQSGGQEACWPFVSATRPRNPRGQFQSGGKSCLPQAVAYELASGEPVPLGMFVGCASGDSLCCNPAHMVCRPANAKGSANGYAKMTEANVREARAVHVSGDREFGGKALAKKFGITASAMNLIVTGKRWSHLTAGD